MTTEELIKRAIKHKYTIWGVSEHIYSPYWHNPMSLETKENAAKYISEMLLFKEKYRKEIDLKLAFEMDVVDAGLGQVPVDFINQIMLDKNVDYAIGGYHSYGDRASVYASKMTPERFAEMLANYELLFTKTPIRYIAHPDAFVEGNGGWESWFVPYVNRLLDLAKKHNVVLGVNVNGLKRHRKFPAPEFWELAAAKQVEAILELDVHSKDAFSEHYINEAKKMAENLKVNLIETLPL